MTAVCPEEFIATAERLADAARPIAQRYFRADIEIESKATVASNPERQIRPPGRRSGKR